MKIKSLSEASHLERRLGIGVNHSHISELLKQDTNIVLSYFIPNNYSYVTSPKIVSLEQAIKVLDASKNAKKAFRKQENLDRRLLVNWWIERIHHTLYPLEERMTLFWHNHFTSSLKKTSWPQLMHRQNELFRRYALGSFADLLHSIYKDPAMLIFLDGSKNKSRTPNENFARELLELFTLGEGNYTENDVVSASRAFTGWEYNHKAMRVIFHDNWHDNGTKHFMGQTGRFDSEGIINILLQQPRTAEFITEKFWHHFVSSSKPEKKYIDYWSTLFRDSHYHIPVLLNSIIQSEPFWADENRGALIKSPIEFTIGLLRELKLDHFNAYQRLNTINKQMGQHLFYPPDVKGWRGGKKWISNETFVFRNDFVTKMEKEHSLNIYDNDFISRMSADEIADWLLAIPANNKQIDKKELLLSLLQDPAYQLR